MITARGNQAAFLWLLLLGTTALFAQSGAANSTSCTALEFRQLDFWIGDWDAFDYDNQQEVTAHTQVTRILGDCALFENYEDTTGTHGQSFSIYDSSRKIWHQTWVTNHGQLLVIEGKVQGDELVLSGTDNAKGVQVRATWKPIPGGVREMAFTSSDSGKTWKQWFDLIFRPHSGNTISPEEKNNSAPLPQAH